MKKKINELSSNRNYEGQCSDLYTRYKFAFDKILRLNDAKYNSDKYKDFYIADSELDLQLDNILKDSTDTLSILLGYGGIGKSTSLRNFFGYTNLAPILHKESQTMIFPATFNGYVEEYTDQDDFSKEKTENLAIKIKEELSLRINAVCSMLEDQNEDLRQLFISKKGQWEYYSYLKESNPHALEHLPDSERISIAKSEEWERKLEYAYKKERFICATTKLKYYLGKKNCHCNKIIVILDDIEPLPYPVQRELVMQYVRFFECMKNTSKTIEEKNYVINLLISMRPHTYRILKEYRAFKAFYVEREILKKNMVNLGDLFQKKVTYYKKNMPHENEEAWDSAFKALKILNNKYHSKFANMIKGLAILDTREAIKIYEKVLENRIWIQRNIDKTASFVITEDNYVFNNITVLRAIACGHHCLYRSSEKEIVPNILHNTADKEYGFLTLCMFSMYFNESDTDYLYGMTSISYRNLINAFSSAFPGFKDIENDSKVAIQYAFIKKILRKSINDTDTPEYLDKVESLKDDSKLYLSPRGVEIWQMTESDSVYLELCREDCYRDYDNGINCAESSFNLLLNGQQGKIFEDLLLFLLELLEDEWIHVSYANEKGTLPIYKHHFGNEVICEHLYKGITNSIDFSGYYTDTEIRRKCRAVENTIEKIRNILA